MCGENMGTEGRFLTPAPVKQMEQEHTQGVAKHAGIKRAFEIILNVLFLCFFLLCLLGLVLSVLAARDADGAIRLFGHEMRLVLSASMEKSDQTDVSGYAVKDIPVNSLVFIETVPEEEAQAEEWYGALRVGDVLTFRYFYASQETITHRIVEITPNVRGGYTIVLEGDNKSAEADVAQQIIDTSQTGSPNYVIGKVTGRSVALGYLVTAIKSPWGLIFIVIVPCSIIIVFEVIRIVSAFSQKKKRELEDAQRKKDEEIAELKRRLAEARAEAGQAAAADPARADPAKKDAAE